MILSLLFSCTSTDNNEAEEAVEESLEGLEESTWDDDKSAAFDALTEIQMSQGGHLFSTFAGIEHRCFPPDTTFTITSEELQIALEGLMAKYYDNISEEKRIQLSKEASLAQEDYLVLACYGFKKEAFQNVKEALPKTGKWILPEVLSLRDVVISWE